MDQRPAQAQPTEPPGRPGHAPYVASQAALSRRLRRSEVDSWVELSPHPSNSSLSSITDDVITTGLRVQTHPRPTRTRLVGQRPPSNLNTENPSSSAGEVSSQEEYEESESESESDRVMALSGDGDHIPELRQEPSSAALLPQSTSRDDLVEVSDDESEGRTAVNHPLTENFFTPQPNAFSHPPSGQLRHASQPIPGSYFPAARPPLHSYTRHSLPARSDHTRSNHFPQDPLSPSFNAAAEHDEALRASLSSLLSVAAAVRGRAKPELKREASAATAPPRSNRMDPSTLRLVPESALPASSPTQLQEPAFAPTLRRSPSSAEDSTSSGSADHHRYTNSNKRKGLAVGGARNASRERRARKMARRPTAAAGGDDPFVTPTLFTWVVSAGVVVFLSALSFSAGYSLGKEAGRLDAAAGGLAADEPLRSCAREAGRSSFGLKRSLARSAIQA